MDQDTDHNWWGWGACIEGSVSLFSKCFHLLVDFAKSREGGAGRHQEKGRWLQSCGCRLAQSQLRGAGWKEPAKAEASEVKPSSRRGTEASPVNPPPSSGACTEHTLPCCAFR